MARSIKWSLGLLCGIIKEMLDNKFDCILFIDGRRGVGKSSLALKIAYRVKKNFNPQKDIVFSREDVMRSLATKKHDIILADEMVNVTYKRDFYLEDQKTLLKMLDMYRDSCNLFLGCIPEFNSLDTHLKKLVKIRITVLRRGVAMVQLPLNSIYNPDQWDSQNNMKKEMKWKRDRPKYSQLSTFTGFLPFGDVTESQREIYEEVKQSKRNQLSFQEGLHMDMKKSNHMTRFIDKIVENKIDVDTFKLFANIHDINPKRLRTKVNDELKKRNIDKTSRQLIPAHLDTRGGKPQHPKFHL